MNITDTISALLDGGAETITIGRVPGKNTLWVKAGQSIGTGPQGNFIQAVHQRAGEPLPEMLKGIKGDMDHCAELQTKVLRAEGN